MRLSKCLITLALTAVCLADTKQNTSCIKDKCGDDPEAVTDVNHREEEEQKPENKTINDLFEDFTKDNTDDDRTWRLNRKALVPILIGLALKALALTFLSLTALTVIGSVAIGASKLSLTIIALMFIRRFFSSDVNYGGFFGLNPMRFPQHQEPINSYGSGQLTRRLWNKN